jgi:hypothetical protein
MAATILVIAFIVNLPNYRRVSATIPSEAGSVPYDSRFFLTNAIGMQKIIADSPGFCVQRMAVAAFPQSGRDKNHHCQ